MKESSYLAALSREIEIYVGGKVIKRHDASTLGLPDSEHVMDGIVVYLEAKIDNGNLIVEDNQLYAQPWNIVKKYRRQFEVCKLLSQHALVLYCIYYARYRFSAILTIEELCQLQPKENGSTPYLHPNRLNSGHGIKEVKAFIETNRRSVYERLKLREDGEGISREVRPLSE
jgi:hypothetical protein